MKKSNYLFWFWSMAFVVIGYVLFLVYRISPFSFGSVVYYCRSLLASMLEYLPFAGLILFCIFIIVRMMVWHRQMAHIKALPKVPFPPKVKKIITNGVISISVHIFCHDTPYAFCYGFLRPSIYLSSGLVALMSASELRAILLHEQQHIFQHDTRIITLMRTLSWVLFPFPFFWEITSAYSTQQEILADQYVFTHTRTFVYLKSALKKLLVHQTQAPALALSFSGYQAYSARINAITGTPVAIPLPYKALYISVISLAFFSVMLLLPVNKTEYKVNNQHVIVMCYDNQSCELSCINRPTMSSLLGKASYQSK